MHEFSLYGQVPGHEHDRMLQQLAGVTRMQPKSVQQIHLVFKTQTPVGLQIGSAGRTSSDKQQEAQRIMRLLSIGVYYVQVVGKVETDKGVRINDAKLNGDVEMANGVTGQSGEIGLLRWQLEFNDTPEAGKQALSTRYVARTPIEDGDVVKFMKQFGYEYVSRYMVVGVKYFDRDTTIFLHRVMRIPDAKSANEAFEHSFLERPDSIEPLDGSGGYLLQASIQAVEGNSQEVKDRATGQLLALKETLKQTVSLTPGNRLALDTRLPAVNQGT